MPKFNGQPVYRFRTSAHPLQGTSSTTDAVGTYLGENKTTGTHLFSAEATGGGTTDSIAIPHDKSSGFVGKQGHRYVFGRGRTSADIRPYEPKTHYGIAGAPLSDTPEDMSDSKFQGK